MPNVLSAQEAANFVRTSVSDAVMLQLLPLVDSYLLNATGHDWAADSTIHATAKTAAGILLVHWYDTPAAIGQTPAALSSTLVQLEAEALKFRKFHFEGRNGAGGVSLPGARVGDAVISLTGVYGVSGNQTSLFEAVISADDQIQQTSGGDHSQSQFVAVLKHPAEDVNG